MMEEINQFCKDNDWIFKYRNGFGVSVDTGDITLKWNWSHGDIEKSLSEVLKSLKLLKGQMED